MRQIYFEYIKLMELWVWCLPVSEQDILKRILKLQKMDLANQQTQSYSRSYDSHQNTLKSQRKCHPLRHRSIFFNKTHNFYPVFRVICTEKHVKKYRYRAHVLWKVVFNMAAIKNSAISQEFVDPGSSVNAIGRYEAARDPIGRIQGYGQNLDIHLSSMKGKF